ncbi:TPA: winged helix-turn-helix domain-containing protein [Methanosarcina acetivorans]|nr:winged helix-turn-helix domain-containing protein [Methanosarcina acetivorans]HIH94656.1 winged helix-turn-helix domain-containing protein [Methanosarcina acetivorans]
MKMQLVNLLLFSDKRKNFLLLLTEGPRNIDEILDLLQVSRISLLPHIKKLKEEGLIIQNGEVYSLSIIGNILVKKARPLLDVVSMFEENDLFWSHRKLDSIPFHLLKRLGDLKGSQLLEPGLTHGFDLFPELINHFTGSSKVILLFSYFHPQIPSFSLELAKRDIQVQLILSRDSFDRFSEDFRDTGEKILAKKNASIFVYVGAPLEIPALIAISESALLIGFFNTKGRFEGQYILNFEPRALSWGNELFEYYMGRSEKVCSMDCSDCSSDDQKVSHDL